MSDDFLYHAAGAIGLLLSLGLLVGVLRLRRRLIRGLCTALLVLTAISTSVLFWYVHRPLPPVVEETLFQGIEYVRDVRSTPRALVIHVVRIDLDAPGIRFYVQPGRENIPAQTVSQFLDTNDLQLAINADYFEPWRDNFPWDYYPHVGDPVNTRGLAASEGIVYSQGYAQSYDTLYISAENRVSFDTPNGNIYNAVSGNVILMLNGIIQVDEAVSGYVGDRHPRTAVGLDESGRTLILLLVDGRQPNYSEGVSLRELAELMREYGAYHAMNLDGGGSTTLVVEGTDGAPQVLNSPIHNRIPGRERPIANQLGIYAQH